MISFNLESVFASTVFDGNEFSIFSSISILTLYFAVWTDGFLTSVISSVVIGLGIDRKGQACKENYLESSRHFYLIFLPGFKKN